MVAFNFNAAMYDPNTGGEDIFETGEYMFQIVSSDTQLTKKKDGTMLIFGASCLNEGFVGRRMTIRLNLQNPNPQAVEIALRDLSAISYVVGVVQWQNTQQLHGIPFRMRVEKVPRSDNPEKWSNNILGYLDAQGNPPKANPSVARASAAPAAPPQQPQFAAPVAPTQLTVAPSAPPPPAAPQAFAAPVSGVPQAPMPVAPALGAAAPAAPGAPPAWVQPGAAMPPNAPWTPPGQ